MSSGSYSLAIVGFRCVAETRDDLLEMDGKGDEIYFMSDVRRINGVTGKVVGLPQTRSSLTMGDKNNHPERIGTGSRSALGGIKTGDTFPSEIPYTFPATGVAHTNFPPYVVWHGTLKEGDAETVMIMITLWEWDGQGADIRGWVDWLKTVDDKYGVKAKEIFNKVYPPNELIFNAVSLGIQTLSTVADMWGNPKNRPIGLQSVPGNDNIALWLPDSPLIFALTYESAEYLCAQTDSGIEPVPGVAVPGLVVHTYVDDPRLAGQYEIYCRLFKTGGATTGDRASLWKLNSVSARTSFVESGPFPGWIPVNCQGDSALWRNDDGRISLWQLDAAGNRTSFKEHGPFPDFVALNFAGGRILWRNLSDGRISLWRVDAQGERVTFREHGPFDGWTAINCDKNHVLWQHTSGLVSLWFVDDDGAKVANIDYGPFPGFTALNYADGHILWQHTSGRISLWKLNDQGERTSFMEHGPFRGWKALNCANNNVLWRNDNGLVSLWSVDDRCAKIGSTDYGPFPGWTALNYADRRILWQGS